MKILHTSDWHVGKTLRGRSRSDEHRDVLDEIVGIADREQVDVVLVVGDLFDTAAPTPEAEKIVYRGLLDLAATGASVVVIAGNHDNERRLQAVKPVLERGDIIVRAELARAGDGGVIEGKTDEGERYRIAALPFLSQRHIVRADDLMSLDADQHSGQYAERMRQIITHLCNEFDQDAVNIIAGHLTVAGAATGGGERSAHTIFDYWVTSAAFPAFAHYVALGHLHRAQQVPGPCPIWYSGSPLQLDFGETANEPGVLLVEAKAGAPAQVEVVPLEVGRSLRTITGTMQELSSIEADDDAYLKVVVRSAARSGLANEIRERFPNAVDVEVVSDTVEVPKTRASRSGRSPHELFAAYLEERDVDDDALKSLFAQLLEESHAPDPA